MKAGIIAAGHGCRFLQAGWKQPKPLIPLCGKPLIDHALENLLEAGVEDVGVLLNGELRTDPVEQHLIHSNFSSRLTVWRKTTRSSYESFSYVYQRLGAPPFVISTVDTLFDASELKTFLDPSRYDPCGSLVLGLTEFVHDPRPLWAEVNGRGVVICLGENVSQKRFVTAGIYLVLKPIPMPEPEMFSALRDYLSYVVGHNGSVLGSSVSRAIDVDCPDDVAVAESFLLKDRCQ